MDWTQVFVILGTMTGGFFYLSSRIDNIDNKLSGEIQKTRFEIQKTREEILWIKFRLDPNEHPQWKKDNQETKEN